MRVDGDDIAVNAAVEPGGSLRVELRDETGRKIPGRGLDDCEPFNGDEVTHVMRWRGGPVQLAGQTVRAHFVLDRARLYAFRFSPGS